MPLDDSLRHHGAGHFHESGYVGSLHVVDVATGFGAVFYALGMDVLHDAVEVLVHFFLAPGEVDGVLCHFKS